MKKGLLALILAVSSIVLGTAIAAVSAPAFAQNVDTQVTATDSPVVAATAPADDAMRTLHGQMRTEVRQRVADKLGVTVEQMDTARTEARKEVYAEHGIDLEAHQALMLQRATERLQLLVDEGAITQEEMDQQLQQIQNGDMNGLHGGLGHGHRGLGLMGL